MRIGVTVPLTRLDATGQLPTWPYLRDFAQHAEAVGVDSIWVFDHLYSGRGDVPPEAIHEAWTLQSALAAVTSRVELGQLVTCVSFRNPAVLAKMAVTADEISGGRITLGIGAGWYDREYHDFGFPTDHRGTRFAEALDIIVPLLRGDTVTVKGRFHQTDNAVLLPPPSRQIPLLIAGQGPRMLRLTARHADAWNTAWYAHPTDLLHERLAELRAALDAAGRDPATLRCTVGMIAPQTDAESLRLAINEFTGLGIDDLIVHLEQRDTRSLDMLAEAVRI